MTDALKRYQELTANGAEPSSPVERLRAFCSLAMGGQDWLDVEPFFDAILDHVEAQKAENERLTQACRRAVIALAAATDQMPVFAADYAAVSDALKEQR